MLLEQAADAFRRNCYSDLLVNETQFQYRIISGMHDKPVHIKPEDDVLIVSKDSIIRNLDLLGKWLKNQEIYLIIDEAHHATAKSYRRITDFVEENARKVKLLGLTATPFRTSEKEQGLLGRIFTDDIVYKVDLMSLVKKGILSTPKPETCETQIHLGDSLGLKAVKSIEELDIIPDDVAEEIANHSERNSIIVKRYFQKPEEYGPTLVFALNRTHAFVLKALFEKYGQKHGIKAGVIVSGTKAEFIGIDISNEENARQIEAYRNGDIQILINVNILTEGTDLPKTQTVFLTRPTISTVMMTQMVGRALRGEAAGGTKYAYIVSFVDDWNNKVSWVSPESLISEGEFPEQEQYDYQKKNFRLISISKIEEFARIVDETIDTRLLESIDFVKKIPLGMYVFSFIDENNLERNHQILIYDSTEKAYQELIAALPELFLENGIDDEIIEPEKLNEICQVCEQTYFYEDMMPQYNRRDLEYLFKFYAQKETDPLFIPIDEIDRKKVDLSIIAHHIVDKDMRRREQEEYINTIWGDETGLVRIYYGNKYFFKRQLETEIDKIFNPEDYLVSESNATPLDRPIEELSLQDISRSNPEYARALKEEVYSKSTKDNGLMCCSLCGKASATKALFHIDHIIPMAKGGLSVSENLQLLCKTCNILKGDK